MDREIRIRFHLTYKFLSTSHFRQLKEFIQIVANLPEGGSPKEKSPAFAGLWIALIMFELLGIRGRFRIGA